MCFGFSFSEMAHQGKFSGVDLHSYYHARDEPLERMELDDLFVRKGFVSSYSYNLLSIGGWKMRKEDLQVFTKLVSLCVFLPSPCLPS